MKRPRCTAEVASLRRRAVPVLQQAGFEISEISALFAIDANNYAQRPGVCKPDLARDATMASMFRDGKTLEYIGAQFGLTRERVRQILKVAGVHRTEGGREKCTEARRSRAAQRRDEACMQKYGCTHAQRQELLVLQRQALSRERGPIGAFGRQKASAVQRGIGWNLSLWQWWTVWQESGKWEQRGVRKGQYCMSRIGDSGPYELGNVRIVTVTENIKESYATLPWEKRERVGEHRDALGMTARERAYFELAQSGLRASEIAARLGVKAGTVSCLMASLRRRARATPTPAPSQEAAA